MVRKFSSGCHNCFILLSLTAYGADVTFLRADLGDCPSLEQFEKALGAPNSVRVSKDPKIWQL